MLKQMPEFIALQKHYDEDMSEKHMRELFKSDPDRFKKFRCSN